VASQICEGNMKKAKSITTFKRDHFVLRER
jgi:hypothetical protein